MNNKIDISKKTEIFYEVLRENYKQDVRSQLQYDEDAKKVPEKDVEAFLDKVTKRFERLLSKNDAYFEAYWDSVNLAISEALEEI